KGTSPHALQGRLDDYSRVNARARAPRGAFVRATAYSTPTRTPRSPMGSLASLARIVRATASRSRPASIHTVTHVVPVPQYRKDVASARAWIVGRSAPRGADRHHSGRTCVTA